MNYSALQRAAKLNKERKKRKRRYKVVSMLAAIVVFCTTYALILPAITMNNEYFCGYEAHVHTDECYESITAEALTCTPEKHIHASDCFDSDGTAVCGYADIILHCHNEYCYDSDGKLLCTLEEIKEHIHTDSCYETVTVASEEETKNAKDESLPEETETLGEVTETLGEENETLGEENETALEETETSAAETEETETSSKEPVTEKVLICTDTLLCEHKHTSSCKDADGDFICGYLEVTSHTHSEDCMALTEVKELVCTVPEHTHDETLCTLDPNADVETKEQWESTLPESRTGQTAADLMNTAKSQIGYKESETNKKADAQGNLCGYTRYGDWAGASHGVWNAHFASFCMYYTDSELFGGLCEAGTEAMRKLWLKHDLYEGANDHAPEIGDLIFLDMDKDATADHVGIISGFNGASPTAIFGDWDNAVTESTVDDSSIILGYGLTCILNEENAPVQEEITSEDSSSEETSTEDNTSENETTAPKNENSDSSVIKKGETAEDTSNFDKLEEEGFFTYWEQFLGKNKTDSKATETGTTTKDVMFTTMSSPVLYNSNALSLYSSTSDEQIIDYGGSNTSDDGTVTVSKTIKGTELENVFDITLTVDTSENLEIFKVDPDMSIVIVMDISYTMHSTYGDTSRYAAAITAAEHFIDKFDENAPEGTNAYLGFVAFNTSGHEIFDLQECTTPEQATELKNEMRQETGVIMNATGYDEANTRFTNIEAGLAMGYDMLKDSDSDNKYIIFLSDGFPTTYMKTGTTTYEGYDPNCSSGTPGNDGVFYDSVYGTYCKYGTSYSDKAAIRAREKAMEIKDLGAKIFSIGVDVGGQSLQGYIDRGDGLDFSVVDRTGTTYEIGDPESEDSFPNWLRDSIGSNYYYDSNNSDELEVAFQNIFDEIKTLQIENTSSIWAAVDPLPLHTDDNRYIEFIHFYDQNGDPQESLSGTYTENGENTAYFDDTETHTIHWDLKESGYELSLDGTTTHYSHSVSYRVRLENEDEGFTEDTVYQTNDTTVLTYQSVTTTDGKPVYSETKTVEFPLPSVIGYESQLSFDKVDHNLLAMENVEFILSHDTAKCSICHGDGTSTEVGPYSAFSDADGKVSFTDIPSGHIYTLTENVPDNYRTDGDTYTVTVAYDDLSVTVTHSDGTSETASSLDKPIVNYPVYLPETESLLVTKDLVTSKGKQINPLLNSSLTFTFRVVACDTEGQPTEELFLLPGTLYTVVENCAETGTGTIAEDGTFKLKAGQTAVFADLLEKGSYEKYAVEELIPTEDTGSYEAVSYTVNAVETVLTGTGTNTYTAFTTDAFSQKESTSVIYRNTVSDSELCDLTVTKTLGSDGFDEDETFRIQLTLEGTLVPVGTEYTVDGETRTVTEAGIIELKAEETALFEGLLKGTQYSVKELLTESENSSSTTLVNAALNKSVSISSAGEQGSAYRITDGVKSSTNYYWEGGLAPSFFTVDLGTKYNVSYVKIYNYWGDGRSYKYQIYTSLDNQNFTLATETAYLRATSSGNTIYFDEETEAKYIRVVMPEGNTVNSYCHCVEFEAYGYTPDESAVSVTYSATVGSGASATIDGNGVSGTLPDSNADIVVTNTKNPFSVSFPVSKTAIHNTGDTSFEFKVEQVEKDTWSHIADVNGTSITVTDSETSEKNITVSFPADTSGTYYYKVSEVTGEDSYIYDENFYIVEVTASGTFAYVNAVYKNGTEEVTLSDIDFVNTRKSELYVSKLVDANDRTGTFEFTATVTLNGEAVELEAAPEGANYTVSGNVITFTLQDGEYVHIDNLPFGSVVTVNELLTGKEFAPFYKIEGTHDTAIHGSSSLVNMDDSTKSVRYINKAYYEIPATGGLGKTPFTAAGTALVILAAALTVVKRRKKDKI